MTTPVTEFPTGARRGTDHLDCDISLIPPEAIRAWGRAFAEGKQKYGRDNWLKGFPQMDILNHALQHIFSYIEGDTSEDHLGHALWNVGVAIHQHKCRPDMIDLPPYEEKRTDNVVNVTAAEMTAWHSETEVDLHGPGGEIDLREHGPGAEELVKEVYPFCKCVHYDDEFWIDTNAFNHKYEWVSDSCITEEDAWQSALDRINVGKSKS